VGYQLTKHGDNGDVSIALSQRGRATVGFLFIPHFNTIYIHVTAVWSGIKLSVVCVGNCFTDLMNRDEDEMILAAASEIAPLSSDEEQELIIISSESDKEEENDIFDEISFISTL